MVIFAVFWALNSLLTFSLMNMGIKIDVKYEANIPIIRLGIVSAA